MKEKSKKACKADEGVCIMRESVEEWVRVGTSDSRQVRKKFDTRREQVKRKGNSRLSAMHEIPQGACVAEHGGDRPC